MAFNFAKYFKSKSFLLLILITLVGAFFRFYNISFGLPLSYHADEAEIIEFAIKYTFEIRQIISQQDFYKLIPVSFVYGTFPVYLFTFSTMVFSKFHGFLDLTFERSDIYIFLRNLNGVISLTLIPAVYFLYKKTFSSINTKISKNKTGAFFAALFIALNWKIIVHSHYLNVDLLLTILLTFSLLFLVYYIYSTYDTKFTILSGLFFGLAFGTKVTALISLPIFVLPFLIKKEFRNFFGFLFTVFGAFAISNPFSLIFVDKFILRIIEMRTKESAMVFDSVDLNHFKYFNALVYTSTPVLIGLFLMAIFLLYKKWLNYKDKNFLSVNLVFIGNVLVYLLFFSIGDRRVDRWLLPLIPIISVYAAFALSYFETNRKALFISICAAVFSLYLYYPFLLLLQFNQDTPRTSAYKWSLENLEDVADKYVITEEGLDPMNELPSATVKQINVYENEGAQYFRPENPMGYHYVILSSRPMQNYKREAVKNKYPFYFEAWQNFESIVTDSKKFELVKSFELPKPNLIPLSNIYIYKNLNPTKPI